MKKIGYIFSFLGKIGGIPLVEEYLSNEIENKETIITPKGSFWEKRKQIKSWIKRESITTIFYQFHVIPLFLITKKSYTIKIHDLYFTKFKYFFVFLLTIFNSIFAKYIIVPSISTKNRLENLFKKLFLKRLIKKIKVISNPFKENINEKILDFKDLEQNILCMTLEKLPLIYKKVKRINHEKKRNLKIIVPGKFLNFQKIKSDIIEYPGYVSNRELKKLYKKSLAVFYYNLNEGFGYIPLESIFYGTPIITNPDYSISEILWDFGLYYRNNEEIDNQLKKILNKQWSNNFKEKIKKSRKNILKKYTPKGIKNKINSLLLN